MEGSGKLYAWGAAILIFVVLVIITPSIPQSQEYHDFADRRELFLDMQHFYLLAEVEEAKDKQIYKVTRQVVSGHTLKHLFVAMVAVFLALMLAKREIEPDRCRTSLLHKWKVQWITIRKQGRIRLKPLNANTLKNVEPSH